MLVSPGVREAGAEWDIRPLAGEAAALTEVLAAARCRINATTRGSGAIEVNAPAA